MKTINIIHLHGHPAALVAGNQAIIPDRLDGADRARVQAKALYAIEIAEGKRRGPYTDTDAEDYARSVAARNQTAPAPSSRPGQPPRRRSAGHRRRRGV